MPLTDSDRLFPVQDRLRALARDLYTEICELPIVSPHGHCDPRWFAENARFGNPAELFVIPDHYIFRMLASQGIPLTDIGVPRQDGRPTEGDPRKIWRLFAENFHLFRATPLAMWLEHSFEHVFGIETKLWAETTNAIYDHVNTCLAGPDFTQRALCQRFNIEVQATTENVLEKPDQNLHFSHVGERLTLVQTAS